MLILVLFAFVCTADSVRLSEDQKRVMLNHGSVLQKRSSEGNKRVTSKARVTVSSNLTSMSLAQMGAYIRQNALTQEDLAKIRSRTTPFHGTFDDMRRAINNVYSQVPEREAEQINRIPCRFVRVDAPLFCHENVGINCQEILDAYKTTSMIGQGYMQSEVEYGRTCEDNFKQYYCSKDLIQVDASAVVCGEYPSHQFPEGETPTTYINPAYQATVNGLFWR